LRVEAKFLEGRKTEFLNHDPPPSNYGATSGHEGFKSEGRNQKTERNPKAEGRKLTADERGLTLMGS
jgi:hypothetical protein